MEQVEEAEDKIESLIHLKNSKENKIPEENKDKDDQEITAQEKRKKRKDQFICFLIIVY
jgi:hypothetical protein